MRQTSIDRIKAGIGLVAATLAIVTLFGSNPYVNATALAISVAAGTIAAARAMDKPNGRERATIGRINAMFND